MHPFALPTQIYAAGLVFIRVAAIVMLIPGLGDAATPSRIRLSFAVLLSLCLGPVVASALPAMPTSLGVMTGQVLKELLTGLMMGALMRLMVSALVVAGETVSIQTTLSFAQTTNPGMQQPASSVGAFLGLLGTTLIFTSHLDHMFLAAIARSYVLFAPSKPVPINDAATLAIQTVASSFALGIQLAAPVIVFSLIFNVAAGFIARVMPQFQIFFVVALLSVIFGLSIFALSLGLIGLVWLQRYEAFLRIFA